MRDWGRRIKEKLAIGEPPRLIHTFLLGTWFVLVNSVSDLCQFVVLVYQPIKYEAGRKWEFLGFKRIQAAGYITVSSFVGRLLASLVAPLVDRYNLLHHFYVASLATSFLGFVATASLAVIPLTKIPRKKITLQFVLPLIMHFFQPFVMAFTARQFKDTVGAKTRLLFTVFYTAQHAFAGVCTALFFPKAPKYPDVVLKCILVFGLVSAVLCLALFILVAVFIYKMKYLVKGNYPIADARDNLACLGKITRYFRKDQRLEGLLKTFSQKTVYETKKVAKVLLVLLAMSFLMSIVEFWQVAWVKQFTQSAASTIFFSKMEFVTVTNLLTAILIPVVQYALVPQLRKIKLPMPVYSFMICVGYICLSMGLIVNVIIRITAEIPVERYDPKNMEAQYYLFNAMDTHTYVSEGGLATVVLSPGSIKKVGLKVGERLRVMNFWYDVYYSKPIESYQDDLIVCTSEGVYQEYLGDFGWIDGYSASHFGIPRLTFLCQKHLEIGEPTDFCNEKTEFIVMKEYQVIKNLNMPNKSEPYSNTFELNPGYQYTIQVAFHGKDLNIERRDISFVPRQGAWYAFVVWRGDVHLKIKYNLVTIKERFKVNTLTAVPQIASSAVGLAFLEVVISCMIHINTPDSLAATTWALHSLLERIVCPVFILLLFFGATAIWLQAIVMMMVLLFFLGLLAALRIARYW